MQPDDRAEFLRTLNGLAAVKPGAKLTHEALDLWWSALSDWSIADFKKAADHLAKTMEFFPNPYHFEQLRKKAATETVGEAWAKVRAKLMHVGSHDRVSIEPRIDRVVSLMGGYFRLSQTNTDKLVFAENRFRELWEESGEADEARLALPSVAAKLTGPQSGAGVLTRLLERRA